ncbi:MAG: pyridoxal-phosphate dependent enzyme [Gammaproteobacteria bacterium]|nr:pyridoxal-phosphate dependent enzyme [Gammaproteobacteria bacterium]
MSASIGLQLPTINDVQRAHADIRTMIHRTPILQSRYFDQLCGCELYFKCENFQKTGSFKARGACNAALKVADTKQIITHSSGNHGAALAFAAQRLGFQATVVMPTNASEVKKAAVKSYGGIVVECEPSNQARQQRCDELIATSGAVFIPPYNHSNIIAGQGTCALEMLESVPTLDVIVTPVGGGGLISGTVLAAQEASSPTVVVGAVPTQANDAARSLEAGNIICDDSPDTIADGLKVSLADLTWHFVSTGVSTIHSVSEADIEHTMKMIWQRMKIIIEPSCAVTLAAVQQNAHLYAGKKVGLILTGGNVNLDSLPWTSH